jgi:hypothetical protein
VEDAVGGREGGAGAGGGGEAAGGRATDVAVYLSIGGRSAGALRDVAMSMLLSLEHVEAVVLGGGGG